MFSQLAAFPEKPYVWPESNAWNIKWSADTVAGTVVLDDDLSIRFRNTKPQFLSVFFERKKVIRFETMDDIVKFARISLPESLDPIYDQRQTPWSKRDDMPTPMWMNVRVDHCAARVIASDGTWRELPLIKKIFNDQLRGVTTTEIAWRYRIDVQDIAPGDVVEMHWQYVVAYDSNWPASASWRAMEWIDNWSKLTSWRVFFHSDLPILHQRVEIKYSRKHGLVLGGEHWKDLVEEENDLTAIWEHRDLPGCMSEVNARPSEDLPFITIRMKPDDPRYIRSDRLSGIPVQQPYWRYVMRMRESRAFWWRRVAARRVVLDRQNKLVKEFVQKAAGDIPDSLAAKRMQRIHDLIARDFNFKSDRAWFQNLDRGVQRIGDQVNEERIRDISRYDMYAKLINELKADYSTVYLLDRRVGRMTDLYMTPLWDNEFVFVMRRGDELIWMHPKRTPMGWFTDELPFYWEGSSGLVNNLLTMAQDIPAPPVFVELPMNEPVKNLRVVEYTVDLDLDRRGGSGGARVFLSGQFSTLGRAAYYGLPIDSTVDPLYGRTAFDGTGISTMGMGKLHLDQDPPYRFRTDASIMLNNAIAMEADSSYAIDLSRYISHVVPSGFVAATRDLPFYWDFEHADRSIIAFTFAQPVVVADSGTDIQVSTSNASYTLRVLQTDPYHIKVESQMLVTAEKVQEREAVALGSLLSQASIGSRALMVKRLPQAQ